MIHNSAWAVTRHVKTDLKVGIHLIDVPHLTNSFTKRKDEHDVVHPCASSAGSGHRTPVTHSQHVLFEPFGSEQRGKFPALPASAAKCVYQLAARPVFIVIDKHAIDFLLVISTLQRANASSHVLLDDSFAFFPFLEQNKGRKRIHRMHHILFSPTRCFNDVDLHHVEDIHCFPVVQVHMMPRNAASGIAMASSHGNEDSNIGK
mmetsp:Transcript_4271/g.10310  ORF Transcript_4271/g.10310 Transcript_4271/m.10310 type:complete len:204 (-) Transcript_4271:120-731(-)